MTRMVEAWVGRSIAAAFAFMLGGVAAVAQPVWSTGGEGNWVSLLFDDKTKIETIFALTCDNARRTADVSVQEANKRAKRGQPVTIEMSAGEARVVLNGSIATDNGVYGYAKRIDYKSVLDVLRVAGPIIVKMNGNTHILPATGRAAELRQFQLICKLRRTP